VELSKASEAMSVCDWALFCLAPLRLAIYTQKHAKAKSSKIMNIHILWTDIKSIQINIP